MLNIAFKGIFSTVSLQSFILFQMLRTELQLAEGELKDRCWAPPIGLQQWLQLTHEIENKAYNKKKLAAEKQLQQAREAVSKVLHTSTK